MSAVALPPEAKRPESWGLPRQRLASRTSLNSSLVNIYSLSTALSHRVVLGTTPVLLGRAECCDIHYLRIGTAVFRYLVGSNVEADYHAEQRLQAAGANFCTDLRQAGNRGMVYSVSVCSRNLENAMLRSSKKSVGRRLAAAQGGCPNALGLTLEACRHYLLWIARREIDPDLQAKAGASDLVQETMLEAQRDFGRFQGTTEEELLSWLRRLLLNNVSNFIRYHRNTAKRSVRNERPLGDREASFGLEANLASVTATASEQVIEREQTRLLSEAVARLPEDYRQIIQLWHYEEQSFEAIARSMKCAPNTVRNKWMRALKQLQTDLETLA